MWGGRERYGGGYLLRRSGQRVGGERGCGNGGKGWEIKGRTEVGMEDWTILRLLCSTLGYIVYASYSPPHQVQLVLLSPRIADRWLGRRKGGV